MWDVYFQMASNYAPFGIGFGVVVVECMMNSWM